MKLRRASVTSTSAAVFFRAQTFIENYLYPAVRQNIEKHKKLNHHYYNSLKKALYKPAAWIKGILINICNEGDCTLKEASIIGSVMAKVSFFYVKTWF